MPHPDPQPAPRRPALVALVLSLAWLLVGTALVLSDRIPTRADYDQKLYHLRAIKQFAEQWPSFDFWHYLSATTPGYHLLMAAVWKFVSPTVVALQLVAVLITVALIGLLGYAAGRRTRPLAAVAVCLPFLCSPYVVSAGAWLLPDNLGWLLVLGVLLLALHRRLSPLGMAAAGAVLLALVFVRQIHIWSAATLWVGALLTQQDEAAGAAGDSSCGGGSVLHALLPNPRRQFTRLGLSLLATAPAFALLGLFIHYWGGPVPPVFQGWFHEMNYSAGALVLATFGAYGVIFVGFWWPRLVTLWRSNPAWVYGPVVAGAAYAAAVPTTFNPNVGRTSGLWNLAAKGPMVAAHTSPIIVVLVMLGALVLVGLLASASLRQRLILLAAIAGFIAANTANNDLFQRYVDPFVLMLLALMASMAAPPARRTCAAAGPIGLALVLSLITARGVINTPCRVSGPDPPARTPSVNDNKDVPCEMPPPPKPADRNFWPWS